MILNFNKLKMIIEIKDKFFKLNVGSIDFKVNLLVIFFVKVIYNFSLLIKIVKIILIMVVLFRI